METRDIWSLRRVINSRGCLTCKITHIRCCTDTGILYYFSETSLLVLRIAARLRESRFYLRTEYVKFKFGSVISQNVWKRACWTSDQYLRDVHAISQLEYDQHVRVISSMGRSSELSSSLDLSMSLRFMSLRLIVKEFMKSQTKTTKPRFVFDS